MNDEIEEGDHDAHFAINHERYDSEFAPVYEAAGLKPRHIVQFQTVLPFQVPFPDGTCYSVAAEKGAFGSFVFDRLDSRRWVSLGQEAGADDPTMPVVVSRLGMNYVTDAESVDLDQDGLTATFDLLVRKLNVVLTAYVLQTKDVTVHSVAKEMLEFASLWRAVAVVGWTELACGLLILHANIPAGQDLIPLEDLEEVTRYISVITSSQNPFILSEELMLNAIRSIREGLYREAVIYAQSCVETFLGAAMYQMLLVEGMSAPDAERALEETPFMSRVKKEFHTRLGGAWNPDHAKSPVGNWYTNTYLLRNRIAHAGYHPLFGEAENAVSAAMELQAHVIGLIRNTKKPYKSLATFFETTRIASGA